jgi:hypothetical protein
MDRGHELSQRPLNSEQLFPPNNISQMLNDPHKPEYVPTLHLSH